MNNFRNTTLAALSLCATFTACARDKAHYELIQADRNPLPVVLQADSICLVQLMSATIDFRNGGYKSNYKVRKVCPTGSRPLPDLGASGIYKRRPIAIEFRDSSGATSAKADVRGDTLIIENNRHLLRFLRK